jgi:hypothetical protein
MHLITLLAEQAELWMEQHPPKEEDTPGKPCLEAGPGYGCCEERAGPDRANTAVRGTRCTAQCVASGTSARLNALRLHRAAVTAGGQWGGVVQLGWQAWRWMGRVGSEPIASPHLSHYARFSILCSVGGNLSERRRAFWAGRRRCDAELSGEWPLWTDAVLELTFQLLDLRVQELMPDGARRPNPEDPRHGATRAGSAASAVGATSSARLSNYADGMRLGGAGRQAPRSPS